MSTADLLSSRLDSLRRRARIAAVAGVVLSLIALAVSPARFYQSYLVAFLYWVGISAGCLATLMLHKLVGGIWGFLVRRPAEAGALTVILMAVLFIPIAVGLRELYPWADPHEAASLARFKREYLSVGFFLARVAIYFGLWIALALLLDRGSRRQDQVEDPAPTRWLQQLSGPGLALWFLSMSFAMIDWGMSLEPEWFSTIYGPMLLVGHALATLAFLIVIATWLSDVEPFSELVTHEGFNDLGNLLLAFTMLWAYMSFSQYLITWSGNTTEEITWYLKRSRDGWRSVAVVLIIFHFFVPFFLLLSRDRKRNPHGLVMVAAAILVMHFVDLLWLILPSFPNPSVIACWAVVPATIGIGGLWLLVFAWQLKSKPLVPRHDPQLEDVIAHHEIGE